MTALGPEADFVIETLAAPGETVCAIVGRNWPLPGGPSKEAAMPDGQPNGQNELRRNKSEDDITAEALARFAETPDPRLRQIMLSLIGHLHAFVKEVQLTEAEWFQAIEILTQAGKMCSDKRQEFILFSDTLGVSMVVDLLDHRKPEGATESTVFGPFHRLGAPEMPAGGNIAHRDLTGVPTLVSGRVLDLDGRPIAKRASRSLPSFLWQIEASAERLRELSHGVRSRPTTLAAEPLRSLNGPSAIPPYWSKGRISPA